MPRSKSIFQQYNSASNSGKYYIDQDENIYFAREGQMERIAEKKNIDYFIIGDFNNNICLYGKLDNKAAGKYVLTSDGPKITKEY